jgi:translation initiation factor IF-2
MVETGKKRDEFDASSEGKKRKALKAWFSSTRKRAVIVVVVVTIPNSDDIKTKEKEQELKQLDEMRQVMVDKFDRTRTIISNTQKNLRVLQSSKAKSGTSLKTKLLKVLRSLGLSNQAIMAAV